MWRSGISMLYVVWIAMNFSSRIEPHAQHLYTCVSSVLGML